jgi:hypothetical protein
MFLCYVDRESAEGLEKAGFKTHLGMENTGLIPLVWETGGGYYIGRPLTTLALQVVIDWDAKIRESANISSTGTSKSNTVPLSPTSLPQASRSWTGLPSKPTL